VSGLGVAPYTTNYAMPGTGGPGSAMYMFDNGGRPQVNTPPCYSPNPITGKTLVFTSDGTSGDMGLSNGGMGGTYSYFPTIGNTTTNHCCPKRFSSITNFVDFTDLNRSKSAFFDFDPSLT